MFNDIIIYYTSYCAPTLTGIIINFVVLLYLNPFLKTVQLPTTYAVTRLVKGDRRLIRVITIVTINWVVEFWNIVTGFNPDQENFLLVCYWTT